MDRLLLQLQKSRAILGVFFIVALFLGAAFAFPSIFVYLVLSFIVTAILKRPVYYLNQVEFFGFKSPKSFNILIAYFMLFLVIGLFLYLFVPLVDQQIKLIASIDIKSYAERLSVPIRDLEKMIINLGLVDQKEGFLVKEIQNSIAKFSSEWLNTTAIGQMITNIFSYTGTVFLGALAVLFISFFLLYERNYVKRALISLIPNKYFEMSLSAFNKTEALLGNYLTGILIQMLAIFLLAFTGLILGNVKYAITIALFAAIANLIPFLGPFLGATFGIVIGVSSVVGTEVVDLNYGWLIAKILIVFGTVQLADNIIFQPLIFSRSVKAHPLVIFLVVLIGGSINVPFGMIAAIPVYTVIRVSFTEFYKGFKEYRIFRNEAT